MNQPEKITTRDNAPAAAVQKLDRLEDGFGRRLAQRLNAYEAQPGYTVSERLRAARMQALAAAPTEGVQISGNGSASLSAGSMGGMPAEKLWLLVISLAAVVILLLGTLHISRSSQTMRIQHLAQVDTQLLSTDLPLSAYTDPGFEQFLHNRQAAGQMGIMGQPIQTQ